jgi:D-3-phosphoglycerate dehydrogenase / 2-oxoglutarate reductase
MIEKTKRAFFVRQIPHEIFIETVGKRKDIALHRLDGGKDDAQEQAIVQTAHAFQVGASRDELPSRFHVGPALLARAPNLLIASSNGAGFDPIDVATCTKAGIVVLNQSGGNARSVAEHAVGMLLVLSKRIPESDAVLKRGAFQSRNALAGREVAGKTVGLIGIGATGSQMAALCGGALALRVLASDPHLDAAVIEKRGAKKVSFADLLAQSDFISVHCPLNAETRGMFGAAEFAAMRKGAIFITTARGEIHDEAALARALASGHLSGAGLDVWQTEPPRSDHPLLAFDNVISSAHTAGVTAEARRRMGLIAAEQLVATLDGRCPPRLINPEAWPKYSERFERAFGFRPDPLTSA